MVIILSNDLFLTSQLQGAVQRAGSESRIVSSQAKCLELAAASPPRTVIVDVETPGLDLPSLKSQLGEGCRLIAYGPHLRTALLEAAEAAGCDAVLTRGQIAAKLDQILLSAR
ncbi:hypothetical protein [Planctomicrobium sp. SH664]|uniref:hypothetical protein n=1 Tax=Planctomicrobium sp. SH664 TaxID=3448125 RepID=UPI003F5C0D70